MRPGARASPIASAIGNATNNIALSARPDRTVITKQITPKTPISPANQRFAGRMPLPFITAPPVGSGHPPS
ncbi:hypothetical protein FHX34_101149 [Actinoplanes teichomyceticus]|uniref:Uncharacterized protein n=1 Tax=Actinoplanes teichomyceticus TaxID=1867 RepID=A0A561WMX4_ACTTI|nr:hypothetical protein FHX34_101149 [Actinoplanes teichomyceticus]GIF10252.1 hypothetical protein Ate01nite_02840 [Actinoplanes teichomyceticus]